MTEMELKAKELYESIEYKYFESLNAAIEYYSNKGDEETRIQLGTIYNKLQGVKYEIKKVDLSNEEIATEKLNELSARFKNLISQYRKLVGDRYLAFLSAHKPL